LECSPNGWIQDPRWDKQVTVKLSAWLDQIQLAQASRMLSAETDEYFCDAYPIINLKKITCPLQSTFELKDCPILYGHFFDADNAQHFVMLKKGASWVGILHECEVLRHIRKAAGETSSSNSTVSTQRLPAFDVVSLLLLDYEQEAEFPQYLIFPHLELDLNSFLHFKSDILVGLMIKVIAAVTALHSMNVMHGDIKPHNFKVKILHRLRFQVQLANFEYAVVLPKTDASLPVPGSKSTSKSTSTSNSVALTAEEAAVRHSALDMPLFPAQTEYFRYDHPWVCPEVYHALQSGEKLRASLACDVFSLGLIIGVAVDVECCSDRNRFLYTPEQMPFVLSNQLDLSLLFRRRRCRDEPHAKKLIECASNLMCLIDPLQRFSCEDIYNELIFV
jgi:serine/threonine protein kinase